MLYSICLFSTFSEIIGASEFVSTIKSIVMHFTNVIHRTSSSCESAHIFSVVLHWCWVCNGAMCIKPISQDDMQEPEADNKREWLVELDCSHLQPLCNISTYEYREKLQLNSIRANPDWWNLSATPMMHFSCEVIEWVFEHKISRWRSD